MITRFPNDYSRLKKRAFKCPAPYSKWNLIKAKTLFSVKKEGFWNMEKIES
jgi:hypothetical protein